MKSAITFFILMLFIFSCSESPKEEKKALEKPSGPVERINRVIPHRENMPMEMNVDVKPYIDSLKNNYDSVIYFCNTDSDYLFYVVKGHWSWSAPDTNYYNNGNFKIGVVNKNLAEIIPPDYDKIYNPGGTIPYTIEVEANGKKGLYDFKGKLLVAVKYDCIYPTDNEQALAQVRLNNNYGWIDHQGKEHFSSNKADLANNELYQSPLQSKRILNWKYNIKANNIFHLESPYIYEDETDMNIGRGILFTPGYLNELGFLPQYQEQIIIGKSSNFGLEASSGGFVSIELLSTGIKSLIAEFDEVGVDARDYNTTKKYITTFDKNDRPVASINFYSNWNGGQYCKGNAFKILENNILQVQDVSYDYSEASYKEMTSFSFYQILDDGKIKELTSPRMFDFTKFIKIDESYFKGCFTKSKKDVDYENGEPNLIVFEHLSIEDLDLMRNEIFAEYGLRFKSPKWQEYFKNKPWYKPEYDDVNNMLTEIDKYNIQVILKMIQKMKNREDEFTKRSEAHYYAAG